MPTPNRKEMICIDCVNPASLKRLIKQEGKAATCQHCGKDGFAVASTLLFDYILARVEENTATVENLSQYESFMVYQGGSDEISLATLEEVLSDWMGLGDECYFDELSSYAPRTMAYEASGAERHYFADDGSLDKNMYDERWETFFTGVRHSHRFFNSSAEEFLKTAFGFLAGIDDKLKHECIRVIRKGEPLYRARSATSEEGVAKIANDPAAQLGPAPQDRASSQRMTPHGIPALYCALERETCLSEIRSITGEYVVSIAMTPTTQLTLLDLTKLNLVEPSKLTILDQGFREASHLRTFVSATLVEKMSTPKGRNDELAYISTQMAFEHLRVRFGSQVDGLVFPSVQTGKKGTNVVLFPECSSVSARNYKKLDGYQQAERNEPGYIPDDEEPFEAGAKLYCLSGTIRFHKVTAIDTKAEEWVEPEVLFMTPLDKKRLGIEPVHLA
ncbi:RES family NAD+ phosphorylase [Paraburkholderia sp. EG287A]|uniref:RES family NAD+ phosphorylase n=1 Tax=unclassified Paraburkholderia TaxID=2615204 RepID=UPI0034D1A610